MNRTEDWLLAAGLDLRAARGSLKEDVPNIACFLSHQAAEKAIAYATEIVEFIKSLLES